jgi:hypothetical protein
MKLTASILVAQFTCGFLRHVRYAVRAPLPFGTRRRRLGAVLHAAIALYEKSGRRLAPALDALATFVLPAADLDEARAVLAWRHARDRDPDRRPFLIEGALHAPLGAHSLDVRMDRLDRVGKACPERAERVEGAFLLAEYKTGRLVDPGPLRAQLQILSYAIGRALGRTPAEWEVELLGDRRIVRFDAERDLATLERFAAGLAAAVERDDREPRPFDPDFCRRCPARRHCPRATADPLPLAEPAPSRESAQLKLF